MHYYHPGQVLDDAELFGMDGTIPGMSLGLQCIRSAHVPIKITFGPIPAMNNM
jgi:hypothetical protein